MSELPDREILTQAVTEGAGWAMLFPNSHAGQLVKAGKIVLENYDRLNEMK